MAHKSGGLIRPPAGLGEFAEWNTSVHGITAEMVATAPSWRKVAAWIVQYAGPDILICHNANFNIGVLRHACTADDIPWPRIDFLCTMILARRAFRLPFVAAECGVELSGRHQVLINARGAALVTVALARGRREMHAQLSRERQAARGPPQTLVRGPSVRAPPSVAVRETADGAHRPFQATNPVRHASVDTATRRSTSRQGDTPRDSKKRPANRENSQLAGRFRRWWQVWCQVWCLGVVSSCGVRTNVG